jgi:hypothetical protein
VQRRDEVRTHHCGGKLCNGEQPFPYLRDEGWLQIAKERPYAIEQLCACTLLTNCCVCMVNGDVGGRDNTFGLSPPMLSEYLRL